MLVTHSKGTNSDNGIASECRHCRGRSDQCSDHRAPRQNEGAREKGKECPECTDVADGVSRPTVMAFDYRVEGGKGADDDEEQRGAK